MGDARGPLIGSTPGEQPCELPQRTRDGPGAITSTGLGCKAQSYLIPVLLQPLPFLSGRPIVLLSPPRPQSRPMIHWDPDVWPGAGRVTLGPPADTFIPAH